MSAMSAADLERRATDERQRLQNTVSELATRVRETVDPVHVVRTHMLSALLVSGIVAFAFGYLVTVPFTLSHRR